MKTELLYLSYVVVFTALLCVPYIIDRVMVRGLIDATGYPADPKPQSAWAQRLMKAHANSVENLVVFAALVLIASAAGISNAALANAAILYFWARVVHTLAYTVALPWVRTLSFTACFIAQMMVAWQLCAR